MDMQQLILQGGALAVILAAFILILRWVLESFTQALGRIERAQYVHTTALLNLSQQLLAHDLTVTGLNPSTGDSFEERDSKALTKYQEIQSQLDEIKTAITHAMSGQQS